ncbi:WD40 repeat domain-containing protein [Streptomyces sp. NPDC051658]|uniref:WD40 repeat domain-containing protein n=1 Tax=Streptomyces sp. NPDC051658 TaxID=3365667 RepID=UPI0037BD3583
MDSGLMWTDTAFLVHADPGEVLRTAPPPADEAERRTAAVYRSVSLRLSRADGVGRAQLLSLEAARFGWPGLAERFAAAAPSGEPTAPWRVGWATGRRADERTMRVMRCDGVHAVLAERNGRMVAVDAGPFGEVKSLDVLDGTSTDLFKAPQDARLVGSVEAGGRILLLTGHEARDRHWNTDRQGPDDTVRAWDLSTGEPVGEPLSVAHGRLATVAAVQMDGRALLVSGGWDGLVRVWDPATGREAAEPVGGHQGWVTAVATARVAGRPVAVTAGEHDHHVLVRDLLSGRPVGRPLTGHTAPVLAVATTHAGGRALAVTASEDHTARVWDLATGEQLGAPLTGHGHRVSAVTTARVDGRTLVVTGGWDDTVRVWDLLTGAQLADAFTGHDQPVREVGVTAPDTGPVVVARASDGLLRTWHLTGHRHGGDAVDGPGRETAALTTATSGCRQLVATGRYDGTVDLWDLARPRTTQPLPGHTGAVLAAGMATAVVDGRTLLLTVGRDGLVRIADLETRETFGAPLDCRDTEPAALATAVVDDRTLVLVGTRTGTVRIWDLAGRQEIGPPLATGDDQGVRAVGAISVDGDTTLVTGHADRTVRIWRLTDRASLGRPLHGHSRAVERVATALVDGKPVAVTTAGYDPHPRVWDLTTGRERGEPLYGHHRRIADLALTTLDDRTIAVTGGDDATVRAWDLPRLALPLPGAQRDSRRRWRTAGRLRRRTGPAAPDRHGNVTRPPESVGRSFLYVVGLVTISEGRPVAGGRLLVTTQDDQRAHSWRGSPAAADAARSAPTSAVQVITSSSSAGGRVWFADGKMRRHPDK